MLYCVEGPQKPGGFGIEWDTWVTVLVDVILLDKNIKKVQTLLRKLV
jgi:hypothetical protein